MKDLDLRVFPLLGLFSSVCFAYPGQAQPILPANDGTGTQIQVDGDRIEILSGTRSQDGTNLFHSFEQFNLDRHQIADFLATPETRNILGRIIGGDPSFINGLLQVSNSNANLYLMNPAGIVFGAGASLNISGDFLATTATGIGFDNNNWFNAFGSNDYQTLVGDPTQFAFDLSQSGAILNAGNLTVNTGQNLILLGGTVVNTGNLTAPEGEITIAAIPGTNLVRISQAGSLLTLDIAPPRNSQGEIIPFSALSLPELLTATPADFNLGLNVNSSGNVQLNTTEIPTETGVAIASGSLDTSGTTGGSLNILGNKVAVISGNLNASGTNDGGNIRIGGDYQGQGSIPNASRTVVDSTSILNANAIDTGNGGRVIVWGNEATSFSGQINVLGGINRGDGGFIEVSAKQDLNFSGKVNTSAFNGQNGTLFLDPENILIISSGGTPDDTELSDSQILAGDRPGDTLIISDTFLSSLTGNVILEATNNITIDSGLSLSFSPTLTSIRFTADANTNGVGDFSMDTSQTIFTLGGSLTIEGENITAGTLVTTSAGTQSGSVIITASGDVSIQEITTSVSSFPNPVIRGGDINVNAEGSIVIETLNTSATVTSGTPVARDVDGGTVNLSAGSSINTGSINTSVNDPFFPTIGSSQTGGDVLLEADSNPGNNIVFSDITTTATSSGGIGTVSGGTVTVQALGLLRGTGTNTNGFTIDTSATGGSSNSSGSVFLQHDGGFDNVPFVVGDSSVASNPNSNGTVAGINTGNASPLSSGTFPVAPNGGTDTPQSNIQITSINTPPVVASFSPISFNPQSGSSTVSFTFNQLAAQVSDSNLDNTFVSSGIGTFAIFISNITSQGTLKLVRGGVETVLSANGSIVTLQPGDSLLYEPPADFTGEITIFNLSASDNVSTATPQPVRVNVISSANSGSNLDFDDEEDLYEDDDEELLEDFVEFEGEEFSDAVLDPMAEWEEDYTDDYVEYFGLEEPPPVSLDEAREILHSIERETGEKPALLYVLFVPTEVENSASDNPKNRRATRSESQELWRLTPTGLAAATQADSQINRSAKDSDRLELLLITAEGPPIRRPIRDVTRAQAIQVANQFRGSVTNPSRPTAYRASSQQLYEWIIAPMEAEMQAQEITNVAFIMASGLRSLPVAALYDGEQFLIEKYSVGLMPSLSLTDTRYQDVKNLSVLAMGAEEFEQLQPLPAVPFELELIADTLWSGEALLNNQFTVANLIAERQTTPYGIIHLATHAEFNPGKPENSYIQFWGETQVSLSHLRDLGLNNPPVELLVLSACRTALGSETAELGFTGLAVQAGVKSGLGSLWYVSDAGTLALMTAFYEQLQSAPIKAEALQQAQLALLRGEARLEGGQLVSRGINVPLSAGLASLGDRVLTHPYYWSGFTLVGSPW
jgi:filamentous hemagglutinin family protein